MAKLLQTIVLAAAAVTEVKASCAYGTHLSPRAEGGVVPVNTFGYSGEIGPAMWHSMNMTTNSACAKGTNQSPIDLVSGTYKEQDGCGYKINLPDFSHGATFENLGTTVEIVGDGGNLTLPSSNKTFEFAQFHFHLPSEHLENGTSMAMEAHFVFQAADAEIAVLGVYMDVGSDVSSPASQVFETVLGSVGDIATPGTATTTPEISMAGINDLFANTVFKTYSGSLTTPPCSEGVNWNVAEDTVMVSLDTWKAARSVLRYNSRFTQNTPGLTNILSMGSVDLSDCTATS